tara:strand:- start:263 stop:1273 length:1011 start_codon:yes stop_codon:yes gene_type:complete
MSTEIITIRNDKGLTDDREKVSKGLSAEPNREEKSLQTPDFKQNTLRGGVLTIGEADSVIAQVQDDRYGTSLSGDGKGGDFANKIIIGVGFLNDGKVDGTEVNLSDPNLRYSAGISIYQRTDTGLENIFISDENTTPEETLKARKATTAYPQKAVSVTEINADTVEIKARNGGVNIIAGYDNTIPGFGIKGKQDAANVQYVGVNLIGGGNPDKQTLLDRKNDRGLQPIPKGDNLFKALNAMNERIADQAKVISKLQKAQLGLELVLGAHTHPTVGLGAGIALPSIELSISTYAVKLPLNIFNFLSNLTATYNNVAQKINMSEVSEGSINSRWNKTN